MANLHTVTQLPALPQIGVGSYLQLTIRKHTNIQPLRHLSNGSRPTLAKKFITVS